MASDLDGSVTQDYGRDLDGPVTVTQDYDRDRHGMLPSYCLTRYSGSCRQFESGATGKPGIEAVSGSKTSKSLFLITFGEIFNQPDQIPLDPGTGIVVKRFSAFPGIMNNRLFWNFSVINQPGKHRK